MKIITPLVLLGLGVVLAILAVALYPSAAAAAPGPTVPFVEVYSQAPIAEIDYSVTSTSPGRTKIVIGFLPDQIAPMSRIRNRTVNVFMLGAQGRTIAAGHVTYRNSRAIRNLLLGYSTDNFGYSFNGITAAVAIPQISYTGPETPQLLVDYPIPSASSYDWSAFPTSAVDLPGAAWRIDMTKTDVGGQAASTPGQAAVGINHARQTTDSNKTFAAGALLGLAGGAILSAV